MNYEDRTDLLPPDQVLSPWVLTRLGSATGVGSLVQSVLAGPAAGIGSAAYEAVRLRIQTDTAPDQGAPPEAAALEEDAMLCGYRLAWTVLGAVSRQRVIPLAELISRTDSMYVYALPLAEAAPIADIVGRNVPDPTGAHEEAVALSWAFGVGLAAVEADLQATDG